MNSIPLEMESFKDEKVYRFESTNTIFTITKSGNKSTKPQYDIAIKDLPGNNMGEVKVTLDNKKFLELAIHLLNNQNDLV